MLLPVYIVTICLTKTVDAMVCPCFVHGNSDSRVFRDMLVGYGCPKNLIEQAGLDISAGFAD
jgi:hypothetical protein